ncbi:MAG: roadblock/LC7 domain-containing protein, partial [Gemmatimonadales bacterium]
AAEREVANLFDQPDLTLPETLGILLVDAGGEVLAGRMREGAVAAESDLGPNMSGARAEAERVAAHLRLGGWQGMVVESEAARIAVAPVRAGVIIVVTAPGTPAGRAARVVDRAREVADRYLSTWDR